MTTDRFAADRERIAAAANAVPGNHLWLEPDDLHRLDAAIRAFETLCEPREWKRSWAFNGTWYAWHPEHDCPGEASPFMAVLPTGDHAADVCRLVCLVMEREAAK